MQRRIDIKLGYRCNNFCRFCIVAPKRNIVPDKSAKEVKNALKKKEEGAIELFSWEENRLFKKISLIM